MTIIITLIIASAIGIFWYNSRNKTTEGTSNGSTSGGSTSGGSTSGNSHAFTSGNSSAFTQEAESQVVTEEKDLSVIENPDSNKPFANLSANSAGIAETKEAPVKPKRKKSPAKTEKSSAKPRRKPTKKTED